MSRDSGVPAGWTVFFGRLEPDETVDGYAARGQHVKGICNHKGCRRRLTLETRELQRLGLGGVVMREVERLAKCQVFGGCAMVFHKEPARCPIYLEQLTGRANVRVKVFCSATGCKFYRYWTAEELIAGLAKRNENSRADVFELGQMMTSACPVCKKVNWRTEVLWKSTGTVEWSRIGERSFDERKDCGFV